MSSKITYSDLSKLSGVSIPTISRIIKGKVKVSDQKTEKVFHAMQILGYPIPEQQMGYLIIVNLPSLNNPFYSRITEGIKSAANRQHCKVLIHEGHINAQTVDGLLDLLHLTNADGLITMNHIQNNILLKLNSAIPLVQCCERDPDLNIPFVSIDDVAGSIKAMNHLLSHGNKRIAFINGPKQYKYANDRQKAYKEALASWNIPYDPKLDVQLQEINFEMAISAVSRLLELPDPPQAFFTASDVYAAAVLRAAKRKRLQVPEDIEVIGFDNVEISSMCIPTITTVSQPRFLLGLNSCDMLIQLIKDNHTPINSMYLNTELIIRESTR